LTFISTVSYRAGMKVEQAFTALADSIREHGQPVCQQTDPEYWFPEAGGERYESLVAKKYCGECPVQRQCALYAIAADEAYGIWGGLNDRQRVDVRNGRISLEEAFRMSEVRSAKVRLPISTGR
jgi:WhiB family redox-sensing transcriptional regulator